MPLQQYHIGGTYYGYDPNSGQIVAFANMQQLQQYFPNGIDPNAQTLPSTAPVQIANSQPGTIVNPFSGGSSGASSPSPTPTGTPAPAPMPPPAQSAPMPTGSFAQQVQVDLSRGDQFLFRFPSTHGNTVYLYDKNDNIYVPFTSAQGFQALIGIDPSTAYSEGIIHDSTNPPLQGQIIPDNYGFDNSGQLSSGGQQYIQKFIEATPGSSNTPGGYTFYGQPQNSQKEQVMASNLSNIFTAWASAGAITQNTLNSVLNNPQTLANYIHASTYGGYSLSDIFMDVKARELGITPTAISSTVPASQYYNTSQYAQAKGNQQLAMPQNVSTNQALLNSPLANLSDNAFKTLVAPVDVTAPAVQQQALSMANEAADLALQSLNATTSQEKAVADQNYSDWKKYIENIYGFSLANDAQGAWSQLTQMTNQALQSNTNNSGILNAAQDQVLNQRRGYDEQLRTSKATQEDMQQRNYLLSSATPDQIAQLTPQQRQQWGLTPSSDLTNWLSGLKSTYPTMSDDEIQQIKNMFVDQNGNMRSQLYQDLYKNTYNNIYGSNGKLSQNLSKMMYQNANTANQAVAAYDNTDSATPFLKSTTPTPTTQPTPTPTQTPTPQPTTTQPFQGLQMPAGYAASSPTTSTGLQMPKATFNSYVKTAGSPTVYGITPQGTYVGFESGDQFLNSGGSWSGIKTVSSVPSNTVNYSNYTPPGA